MPWVRRSAHPPHTCAPPTRPATYTLPPAHGTTASRLPITHTVTVVDGRPDDLWQCDTCAALWRVGFACDWCDYHSSPRLHSGSCAIGLRWRRASWWTCLLWGR
jgi:hypothetical protein